MSAQPVGPAPHHPPKTLRSIRAALPSEQVTAFESARDGLDLDDLRAVAAFRDAWWSRAVLAPDRSLDADSDAAMAGALSLAEPWVLTGSE
ncbi:hypothetical protein [Streptomyces sp. NPDC101455]|uniref:hypothetical protein n=1 Tax=Streptomyces sp. NPDC101455 TaxID=3366142 RepID=UPI003818EA98